MNKSMINLENYSIYENRTGGGIATSRQLLKPHILIPAKCGT